MGGQRQERSLRLLRAWNQLLLNAETLPALLAAVCRTLVEVGGYRFAWIGIADQDESSGPRAVSQHGDGSAFFEAMKSPPEGNGSWREPAATAIGTGEPAVIEHLAASQGDLGDWVEQARQRSMRATVALPLMVDGPPFGVLTLFGEEPARLDRDEIDLLTELAAVLAGRIIRIRQRERTDGVEGTSGLPQYLSQGVVRNLIAGIVVQDAELNFEYVNPAAAEMLGYQPHELIGQHWTKIVPRDQRPIVKEADRRRAQGQSDQYELELDRKDGARITVLVSGQPRMEEEQFAGAVVVFTDISSRVRTERQNQLQASALDAAANAILITDREGTIEWVNPAWTDLTGYSREEAIGNNPRILKSGEQDETFYANLWNTILAGEVWQGEVVNRRKDGSLYTEEETITPILDSDGQVTHFIGVKRDISQEKRAQKEIRRQVKRLAALREIDLAITASLDPHVTFNVLLTQVTDQLQIDAAAILVFDRHTQTLTFDSGRGFRTEALVHTRLKLGDGFAGKAALDREIITVHDLGEAEHAFERAPLLEKEDFVTYYAVPLVAKGIVQGVLEIFHRDLLEPDQDWLDFLEALAGQAAIAIDNAMLFAELNRSNVDLLRAYDTTLEGWARALELRDIETEGHSQRVTEMADRLARRMGVEGEDLLHLRRGALLHDIGKMGIPDSILHNPGELSESELEVMRKHPRYAYELLGATEYLRPALDIPYCHHEKWDGSGYPRGLRGEEIPLAARIFAVVDVWDALRSDRPYRGAWSDEAALQYLERERGRHFDAKVVDTFLGMLSQQ